MSKTNISNEVFDYKQWEENISSLSTKYKSATPFPHIALENFLQEEIALEALNEFPDLNSTGWINYLHFNEKKYGKNRFEQFSTNIKKIISELNSEKFLLFLENLTGIKNLLADWSLEGGGLHQSKRGGYLNIHSDFTVHPHKNNWKRRINVLVYLNKNWEESYGGHLEFWDKDVQHCKTKILPIFNRAVIFNTDPFSFHGHPKPMLCPENTTRKSIALYYFTEEEEPLLIRSTNYKHLPSDSFLKKLLIALDKFILMTYDRVKRIFKLNDKFVSSLLKLLSKEK